MESKRKNSKTIKCPYCGKTGISKILWGYPRFSEKLERDIEEGKIYLGGCCMEIIDDKAPEYYCRWCKKQF